MGNGLGVEVGVGVWVGKGVVVGVAVLVARGGNVGRAVGSAVGVHVGIPTDALTAVGVDVGLIAVGSGARIERMTILPRPTITLMSRMAKTIKMIFCPRLNVFIESFLCLVECCGLVRHFVMPVSVCHL